MQKSEIAAARSKIIKTNINFVKRKIFSVLSYFSIFSAFSIKRLTLIFTVISVSSIHMASCSYFGTGASGSGISSGFVSVVNGFIINKGDIITEVGEYSGGSFRKLTEKRAQIDFDTGTYLKNITIDLTYYEDKQNKIYISGSYAQVNAKNYITGRDFIEKDGYTPLYSIAYDRNTIALAVMIDGAVTTILVDLDKETAEYLIPYDNLYDRDKNIYNQPFIQCLPVEMTDGGNMLVCLETNYEIIEDQSSDDEYFYYCMAYNGVFSNIGEKNEDIYKSTVPMKIFISKIKTTETDNYYCGIVNKNAETYDKAEILAVSGKLDNIENIDNITVSNGDINDLIYVNGSLVNAKATEANIYCSNFLDFDKTEDYLEFREVGNTSAKKYDLGFKIDENFKKYLARSNKYFVLNPSRTKAAVLYKNIIYIMDLTAAGNNSNSSNSVKKINTADYGSSWDADDAIVFIDDKTVIFNSGTTDNDGRMATVPKFINVDADVE